jgi:hypothetical protein
LARLVLEQATQFLGSSTVSHRKNRIYLNDMPSLDYTVEEEVFRTYYDSNLSRLEKAKDEYLNLLRRAVEVRPDLTDLKFSGRVKNRDECLRKF